MRSFKQFLAEATISFNTVDSSKDAKAAGRAAIVKAAEIGADVYSKMQPFFEKASAANIKDDYNKFLKAFPSEARAINALKPDGIGPGEILLYFVFDNVGIGGKNAPIDIYIDGREFAEAKAGGRSGTTLTNFKITKDSDKAVTRVLKDLEDFNDSYHEIHGEDLPGWRGANELKPNTLRGWVGIDLKDMADSSTGSKKAIDLVLKTDGDLMRKGSSDPIVNVKTATTIAPIKKLISADSKVAVDAKISTLDKIVKRWVDQAFDDYVGGKKFALMDKDTLEIKHFGELTKDMVGLYTTHRNQPWAEVYLEPKKSTEETKVKK
jgi:hypothetical protein